MKPSPKNKEKPVTAPRQSSIILTEMQSDFVDAVLSGKDAISAAASAGYRFPVSRSKAIEKSQAVQTAIRVARDELSSAAQISRADVIDGIMEAINIARLSAEPASMIKGWSEVAKILGLYAPEVKKVEMTMNQQRLQSKFEAMTDAELLQIIEGESTSVEH